MSGDIAVDLGHAHCAHRPHSNNFKKMEDIMMTFAKINIIESKAKPVFLVATSHYRHLSKMERMVLSPSKHVSSSSQGFDSCSIVKMMSQCP